MLIDHFTYSKAGYRRARPFMKSFILPVCVRNFDIFFYGIPAFEHARLS